MAIKTCKPEASDAERAKFLEEAGVCVLCVWCICVCVCVLCAWCVCVLCAWCVCVCVCVVCMVDVCV